MGVFSYRFFRSSFTTALRLDTGRLHMQLRILSELDPGGGRIIRRHFEVIDRLIERRIGVERAAAPSICLSIVAREYHP